jgi:hypothetical protein
MRPQLLYIIVLGLAAIGVWRAWRKGLSKDSNNT